MRNDRQSLPVALALPADRLFGKRAAKGVGSRLRNMSLPVDDQIPQTTPDPVGVISRAEQLVRLVYWTSAASRQLRRILSDLARPSGLSDSELLTVWLCLEESGGRVQGDLAAGLGVSPSQMSGIVERLRQRGLIEMHRQALDRRRQVWRGTARARQVLGNLNGDLARLVEEIAAAVPFHEQGGLQSLCQRLAEAVQSLPDRAEAQQPSHPSTEAA